METICLITPPSPFVLDERVFVSIGILRVAACLEQAGHHVEHLDLNGVAEFEGILRNHAAGSKATIFGLTATTPQMPTVGKIAAVLRDVRPNARIILGGPHPTLEAPPPPAIPNGTVTAVIEAVYAANCNNATDLRKQASAACDGSSNCTWFVCVENQPSCPAGSPNMIPDPAYDCEKDLSVSWTCSGDPNGAPPRTAYIAKPAEGVWAQISCYPPQPPPKQPFGSQQTDVFWYLDSAGTKQYMCACVHARCA